MESVLVSRLAGLRGPGHQNHFSSGSIEYRRICRIVLGNHFQDDLRVSDEHRVGERDVVQFLADFWLHFGGRDHSSDLELGCRESRFPQYLGRAGEEIKFPVGVDTNASSKTL